MARRQRRLGLRRALVAGAILIVAVVVFVLVWFQPQKLIIDKHVNERSPLVAVVSGPAAPAAAPTQAPTPNPAQPATAAAPAAPVVPDAPPGPAVVAKGVFRNGEHTTKGRALL